MYFRVPKIKTRTYNPECYDKLLSLKEYDLLAKKLVSLIKNKQLAKSIINNSDTMSYIVEYLIMADMNYHTSSGRRLRELRSAYFGYAIKNILKNLQKTVEIPHGYPTRVYHNEETPEWLVNCTCLSQREKRCLIMRYINGYSIREMAHILKLSKSTIFKLLKKAKQKVKEAYEFSDLT